MKELSSLSFPSSFFTNTRLFFLFSIGTIVIIQFDFFGRVGLALYGLLLLYSLAFAIVAVRRERPIFNVASIFCFGYFIWYLITSCINRKYDGIATIIQLMFFSLIAFIPRREEEIERDVKSLSKLMTISGIVMASGTFLIPLFVHYCPILLDKLPSFLEDYLRRSAGDGFWPRRVVGPCSNPNTTAGFCLISVMASAYLITTSHNQSKWFVSAVVCITLSTIAIFFTTASRTAMLAWIVFVISYVVLNMVAHSQSKKKMLLWLILFAIFALCLLLTIILVMVVNPEFADFILHHVIRIDSLRTGSGRLQVYSTALDLFFDSPFLGIDYSEFREAANVSSAHNIYLQVLVFAGIPGFFLFVGYVVISLVHAIRNYTHRVTAGKESSLMSLILSFMFSYLIYGCTEGHCVDGMRIITIAAFLAFASTHVIKNGIMSLKASSSEGNVGQKVKKDDTN